MSYRDSENFQEARRRADRMARARSDLGHWWHQKQMMAALREFLSEKQNMHGGAGHADQSRSTTR